MIWDYLPIVNGQTIGNATGIYSLLVGFVISLCFIVIVSMVTKAPDETILAQVRWTFFSYIAGNVKLSIFDIILTQFDKNSLFFNYQSYYL